MTTSSQLNAIWILPTYHTMSDPLLIFNERNETWKSEKVAAYFQVAFAGA